MQKFIIKKLQKEANQQQSGTTEVKAPELPVEEEDLEELDLYAFLQLPRDATERDIRNATAPRPSSQTETPYYLYDYDLARDEMALQDKIFKVSQILGNPEKKAAYDAKLAAREESSAAEEAPPRVTNTFGR